MLLSRKVSMSRSITSEGYDACSTCPPRVVPKPGTKSLPSAPSRTCESPDSPRQAVLEHLVQDLGSLDRVNRWSRTGCHLERMARSRPRRLAWRPSRDRLTKRRRHRRTVDFAIRDTDVRVEDPYQEPRRCRRLVRDDETERRVRLDQLEQIGHDEHGEGVSHRSAISAQPCRLRQLTRQPPPRRRPSATPQPISRT